MFACLCRSPYSGDRCELSPCDDLNCNQGICVVNSTGGALCLCPLGRGATTAQRVTFGSRSAAPFALAEILSDTDTDGNDSVV